MSKSEPTELDAFRDAEHAGWQRLARGYSRYFQGLVGQAIETLLETAGVRAGQRVLDVCCGPGYVTAQATAHGVVATGVDFSQEMITLARHLFPKLDFRTGDAESLDFERGDFDAVVMNFGLHHLARPERAIAEAARVLRPGGRFAFTVWALPGENVGHEIMLGAIEAHGRQDLRLPAGPPMFRFSEVAECQRVLQGAGFIEPAVRTVHLSWDLPAPFGVFDAYKAGGVRPAIILEAQSPETLRKIREAVRVASQPFERGGRLIIPMAAVLASAQRG